MDCWDRWPPNHCLWMTWPLYYTWHMNEYLYVFSLSCKKLLFIIPTFLHHYMHLRTPYLPSFSHSPRPPPSLHYWNSNIYIFHPAQPRPSLITSSFIHFIYVCYGTHRTLKWLFHMYTVRDTLDLGLVSHVNWCRECFGRCACSKLKWCVRVVCVSGECYREARFQLCVTACCDCLSKGLLHETK